MDSRSLQGRNVVIKGLNDSGHSGWSRDQVGVKAGGWDTPPKAKTRH